MRISGNGPISLPVTTPGADAGAAPAAAANAAPLESAVLQPALTALQAQPDIDQAKVDALREALARGEMPFDPARLAGLVERFHRNRDE